jgi:hypothetical protein
VLTAASTGVRPVMREQSTGPACLFARGMTFRHDKARLDCGRDDLGNDRALAFRQVKAFPERLVGHPPTSPPSARSVGSTLGSGLPAPSKSFGPNIVTTVRRRPARKSVAAVGVISPIGHKVGPFLSIAQAILSHVVTDRARTEVFACSNLIGAVATALPGCIVPPFPGAFRANRDAGVNLFQFSLRISGREVRRVTSSACRISGIDERGRRTP